MTYYDEQLRQLQEQCARKRRLEAELRDLRSQQVELSKKVRTLEQRKIDEQSDVDRLEGRSLAAFFYNVVGKMDEKLNREREEAYAAAVKYDAAAKELAAVEHDIEQYRAEIRTLEGCERRYAETLGAKATAVKASGTPEATELLHLEETIFAFEDQKRELREALAAGWNALHIAEDTLSSLDSAESWGTWDMFGGGFLSDVIKYGHLDTAQEKVEQLQIALRRFKTELADVTIDSSIQVNIDGFLRFADYFFDGLFADWAVLDKINQSQEQLYRTKQQIERMLSKLDNMLQFAEREQKETHERLEALVLRTSL